ncbi:MAG: hypothetical protein SFW07_07215 [Gammaproteobacteria bacterium]|nr:hypothetical protein [Gammaproteobacteria bacterium]
MEDIKSVNIVFIGRGDMLKQLCGAEHDSNFAVASVTYRGLVVERTPSISSVVDEDIISKADKVFILCSTEDELKKYIEKISHLSITSNFVVMAPDKVKKDGFIRKIKVESLKSALSAVPFTGTLLKDLQPKLLELYPQNTHELIQQQYEKFLADQIRQRDESSPSREYARRNPNADLTVVQKAIKASAAAVVDLAERIKASDDKEFVDREIQELEGLKKQFEEKVKEYTQRISQTDGDLRTQLEAISSEQVGKVDAAMKAAVAAQKVLDERIAEAERLERERREAEDAAAEARRVRLAKLQEEKILSSVFFDVQREVELDSIEDYVASVNFAEESQNSDVMCVVFDPTLPNCENHLREGVERIKAAQKLNLSVRAVFLRAKPYNIQQDLGFGEDLQAHPEKEHDAQMIKGLDVVDPVIVDNLRDFKDKAGYGQPVVFRKENVERADVGRLEQVAIGVRGDAVVAAAEKPQPALNPNRFSFSGIKHSRYERKKLLENNKNLNWLELNKLSVEKRCDTARLIKKIAGVQFEQVDRVKVDKVRYKVVIDLLKFLDREERRLKPKVKTFFVKFATNEYIVKREAQRKLIYGVAAAIFTELESNNAVQLTSDKLNEILSIQLKVYANDGHVRRGILRIIGDNFPDLRDRIRFPQAIPVPEAVEVERVAPQVANLL